MRRIVTCTIFFLLVSLVIIGVAYASGGLNITRLSINGGGGKTAGGNFALQGTVGQPEVGYLLSGEGYTLSGGYWPGGNVPLSFLSFLPIIKR